MLPNNAIRSKNSKEMNSSSKMILLMKTNKTIKSKINSQK